GTGVREVIGLIEKPDAGPCSTVIGMIADFLTVRREYAPLIDLALGEWAQRFVVRDIDSLIHALNEQPITFSGRVSFLPLERGARGEGGGARDEGPEAREQEAGSEADPSY